MNQSLKSSIESARRILLSTHQLPDGDGLGAVTALFHALKRARKSVHVLNPDPVPARYLFLDPEQKFLRSGGDEPPTAPWKECDLWIIVDTNDPRRLGRLWNEWAIRARQIVFLDHHPDLLSREFAALPPHASIVSDTSASSIGELVYELIHHLGLMPIQKSVALGLYVSVMTDTNSFRSAKTTALAHQIAAECIELGVNPEAVTQAIYSSKELGHVQLLGELLAATRTTASGRVAWMELRLDHRRKYRAAADDTLSFLNLLLLLKDAEIVCLFRQEDGGQSTRVSMKSKGRLKVNTVAMELGGGGHDFAAGVELIAPFDTVVETVVRRLEGL